MTTPTYDIIFDYDDVIYPYSETAHKVLDRADLTNGCDLPTQWDMIGHYGCDSDSFYEALDCATKTGELYNAHPYPGVLEEMARLRAHGNRIHIVTARGFEGPNGALIRRYTTEQIATWEVPHDSLTFARSKVHVRADFGIDDGLHNYDALTEAGVHMFLMDRPHNRERKDAFRVHSVREFADLILSVVWL